MNTEINNMLSEMLSALGFGTMAREAKQGKGTHSQFARFIINTSPASNKMSIVTHFKALGLV